MDLESDYLLEACVETVQQAIAAERHGAHRLELCDRLDLDGTSPPLALVEAVIQAVEIPVKVMVRPRGGDFCYSASEIAAMKEYVEEVAKRGASGIVIGVLQPDGQLDRETMREFCQLAAPLEVTLHKAFDLLEKPLLEMKWLPELGVKSVLTSGKAPSAYEGRFLLREMIHMAKDKVKVIVAGKVTHENIEELHRLLQATEYHGKKIVGEPV